MQRVVVLESMYGWVLYCVGEFVSGGGRGESFWESNCVIVRVPCCRQLRVQQTSKEAEGMVDSRHLALWCCARAQYTGNHVSFGCRLVVYKMQEHGAVPSTRDTSQSLGV